MEIRDITNEDTLLFSYKKIYISNQAYELLHPYWDNGRTFPIFLDRVFTTSAKTGPLDFIDYRTRSAMDDADPGMLFVFERNDNSSDHTVTRLFWVWLSPAMVKQFKDDEAPVMRANVVFHPAFGLDKYPTYWRGDVEPVKIPNFLELGVRYLFREKLSVLQHFCALRRSSAPSGGPKLEGGPCPSAYAVVVPVSSVSAYMNLADPAVLSEALRHIGRRCYQAITKRLVPVNSVKLERVAVSAYSRSGTVLKSLLANGRKDTAFMSDSLREIYAFDVMLDEKQGDRVVKTKRQGYDEMWALLKTWQGEDSDKRIRLYSAEPDTVSGVYQDLKAQLAKYGGGFHNPAAKFSSFNGAARPDGSKYAKLADGYEIYSTDNSRSLAVFPSDNALVYLTDHVRDKKGKEVVLIRGNAGGFAPGGIYEPKLEGHSWFISRLMSHALYHSGF